MHVPIKWPVSPLLWHLLTRTCTLSVHNNSGANCICLVCSCTVTTNLSLTLCLLQQRGVESTSYSTEQPTLSNVDQRWTEEWSPYTGAAPINDHCWITTSTHLVMWGLQANSDTGPPCIHSTQTVHMFMCPETVTEKLVYLRAGV